MSHKIYFLNWFNCQFNCHERSRSNNSPIIIFAYIAKHLVTPHTRTNPKTIFLNFHGPLKIVFRFLFLLQFNHLERAEKTLANPIERLLHALTPTPAIHSFDFNCKTIMWFSSFPFSRSLLLFMRFFFGIVAIDVGMRSVRAHGTVKYSPSLRHLDSKTFVLCWKFN